MDSSHSHALMTMTVINHLYVRRDDLEPACGIVPGPDSLAPEAEWHTGRDKDTLLRQVDDGQWCCTLCLEIAEG